MLVVGRHKQISLSTILLFLLNYANCLSKERENRHLFPLLGYLHGYKIGQNFAYQLPPFILSPVVILPSVNQQQSVNVQKSNSGESYQENGGTFQIISPSKLISNITEANNKDFETEAAKPSKTDIIDKLDALESQGDTFRQHIINNTEITTESTEVYTEYTTPTTDTTIDEENFNVTTPAHGSYYPNAIYTNRNISNLTITTTTPQIHFRLPEPLFRYNLTLPVMENNKNLSLDNLNSHVNLSNIAEKSNEYSNGQVYSDATSSFRGYSYPNPWYNPVANNVWITTNAYSNFVSPLPLANDDRWKRFSSSKKSPPSPSEFRPLTGLYHDGFLHKHLMKNTGFAPIHRKYLYFNK